MPFIKLFSFLKGATLKGKNMLPIGSIFLTLIVALFKVWFSQHGNRHYHSKLVYQYRYQNTKDVFPFIAFYVSDFKTVFYDLIFWRLMFIPPIVPNKLHTKYKCFIVFKSTV